MNHRRFETVPSAERWLFEQLHQYSPRMQLWAITLTKPTFQVRSKIENSEEIIRRLTEAGLADLITLVEGDAHEEVTKLEGPIDLLFLDADKSGYVDYLKKLLPRV
ncbi:MAG: O-methyltransferase, partial [Planctomycetaceae bacterium]